MRRVLLVFVLLTWMIMTPVMISSCTLPDPKTVAELTRLKSDVQVLGDRVAEAAEFVDVTKNEILAVIDKGKAGQLTAKEVTELLAALYQRLNEGQERLTATTEAFSTTQAKIKELSASGVPWWQIAIWIALGVFGTATGKGYLKERGNGQVADLAISGINSVVRYMEDVYAKGGTVKDVKVKIAHLGNPLIESAVDKLPIIPYHPAVEIPPKEEPLPRKDKT